MNAMSKVCKLNFKGSFPLDFNNSLRASDSAIFDFSKVFAKDQQVQLNNCLSSDCAFVSHALSRYIISHEKIFYISQLLFSKIKMRGMLWEGRFHENLRHCELFPPLKRSSLAISESGRDSSYWNVVRIICFCSNQTFVWFGVAV